MRIIILVCYSLFSLHAQSIQSLITQSFQKHPSLTTIKHRLSAMDERIVSSRNWSNPELMLNVNDIRLDDPSNRGLEPMQYQDVNYKQRFPWFGKMDAKESYIRAQKDVILLSYDIAKVKLAEEIRVTAYSILEIKERIRIVKQYEKLTNQNIVLYDSYISTDSKSHSNSMSAELLLSRLHIRNERYKAVLKSQEAKLAYLVQRKNVTVSDRFRMIKVKSLNHYLANLQRNPAFKQTLSQSQLALANKEMKALEVNPDPFVQVGYFNREAFEDFASISVGFSLPIFGTEAHETEAARKDALAAESASLDYRFALESEIRIRYAKMNEAYNIYRIINNDSLPKLQHMFELNEASIQSGEDLFTYTSLLEQKLNLDEERTVAKAAYLKSRAKLKSLIGEI